MDTTVSHYGKDLNKPLGPHFCHTTIQLLQLPTFFLVDHKQIKPTILESQVRCYHSKVISKPVCLIFSRTENNDIFSTKPCFHPNPIVRCVNRLINKKSLI